MHSLTLLLALASSCILQCNGQLSPFEETLAAIRFVHLENDFQVFPFFRATSTTTERTVQETTGAAADEVEEEEEVEQEVNFFAVMTCFYINIKLQKRYSSVFQYSCIPRILIVEMQGEGLRHRDRSASEARC